MALQKDLLTSYGITASYWKIVTVQFQWHTLHGEVILGGWVSRAARENGVMALEHRSVYFHPNEWPFTLNGLNHSEAYERLKLPIFDNQDNTQPDLNPFTGATDIFEAGQPTERA